MAGLFRDDAQTVWEHTATVLVRCPRCSGRAMVRTASGHEPRYDAPRVLACASCGHTDTWAGLPGSAGGAKRRPISIGGAADPYFGLPLWLQSPCAGETLWAYNAEHLDFLERYVGAALRERIPNINKSLVSRLPGWMKDRKHRDAVLSTIAKLRATL